MADSQAVRIAVEGCGHGTLDAIYASVQKSCEVRGWDGVDLLIICGDFQAVRTRQDLNVTAMPAKYREMGDFHQYYYGTKQAPFLTVFIGGNHEASNYLFELYYGGWVAPNIYYMGAANVLSFGPLKIAALSGIWKGHDYRKPHFERLPYNDTEMRSVYHQRELDVRKLLAYTSQVDIGMSHDWPHDIWQYGDHRHLFRAKDHLRQDAYQGNLGSKAASQIVDRLRPPFWFSAHLHFKYTALKDHEAQPKDVTQRGNQYGPPNGSKGKVQNFTKEQNSSASVAVTTLDSERPLQENKTDVYASSAWSNFGATIQEDDARIHREALESQREEEEKNGKSTVANYRFEETFKPVTIDEANNAYSRISQPANAPVPNIPQYDGSCFSLPKRRRLSSPSDETQSLTKPIETTTIQSEPQTTVVSNPDAIDLDMSDSDEDSPPLPASTLSDKEDQLKPAVSDPAGPVVAGQVVRSPTKPSGTDSQVLQNGNTDGLAAVSTPQVLDESAGAPSTVQGKTITDQVEIGRDVGESTQRPANSDDTPHNGVSDEIRAQLAAMSSTFAEKEKIERSPDLPLPANITNKVTKFLALSKVEQGHDREFLQLIEVQPVTASSPTPLQRPIQLEYDPEWLAILRTFDAELQVGGTQADRGPPHRGDTFYRDRIVEERVWIDQNIKQENLVVPQNFHTTVERDENENAMGQDVQEMPLEQTNPQTADFCKLIGIENKFDFSEEDRAERVAAGPAPQPEGDNFRGGGRGRGFGRGRGRARGGRGRGRRGRW